MKILTIEELNKMSREELGNEREGALHDSHGVEDEEKSATYKAYAKLIKEYRKTK